MPSSPGSKLISDPSASIKQLAARSWDAIVVGAGHNGLTCAAYLARAGLQVLVLESRNRIGGACTLEETWPGYRVSPCAYVCGLLHPLVIEELDLVRRGLEWHPAMPGLFVPFEDGSSVQLWGDDERLEAEIRRFAPGDLPGWRAMSALKARVRDSLRPPGPADLWIGPAPSRAAIESRLGHDADAIGLLFEWSMVEFVERYLDDERLQLSLLGQGVIGTNASPHEPGTASIHFHHASGRMGGIPGMWGYIKGGMGRVSFMLADVAREAGVQVTTEAPVSRIVPGEGVELEGGERLRAPVVISNADPRTTLRLLGDGADAAWREQVERIPMTGCTVKITVALRELPNFRARPGTMEPHHLGQVNTPLSKAEWRAHYQTAQAGGLPPRLWTELYFQSSHDSSVTPDGKHVMSIFAQPVPYQFSSGSWDSRREEVARVALESIGRFCGNIPEAVLQLEVMGPPDIERRTGLAGGHIFQGECLPDFMWDRRLKPGTPMTGVFLCGAGTYPGGSVIGINGRNAAMEVLRERVSLSPELSSA
ncbi:MAG TPA: NAD(P)/FAD-dependent oxidoreductase [Gemmatimonadales bacterium]|nr:NAD(P)/FAD-dependent oxidoreductase [Gemmatimonadales bacterium]